MERNMPNPWAANIGLVTQEILPFAVEQKILRDIASSPYPEPNKSSPQIQHQVQNMYEIKNQQMSLFQFYSCFDGSLHVSGP
jgi:hypothetical protein